MRGSRLLAVAVVLGVFGTALAQSVPGRVSFSARLTDLTGNPLSGAHAVNYMLYTVSTGGSPVWTESYPTMTFTTDGLGFAELGSTTALTPAVLDGSKLYLEISVDGVVMSPRVSVVSVPYAIRATEAATLGGFQAGAFQKAVSGSCSSGNAIRVIASDGTVTCEPVVGSGGGTITGIGTAAGSGLTGGVTTGVANLSLISCTNGQVLKSNAGAWACGTDNGSAYSVAANSGLQLNSTVFGLANCTSGQILKSTGANTWSCQADANTTYSGTDFIQNNTAAQTANFNITGTGTIGGNTQIGASLALPPARVVVKGGAAVAGAGTVSGSGGTKTLIGLSTTFTTAAVVGDFIVANGQTRRITTITNNTSLSVDANWPADFFNVAYTIQKSIAQVQDAAGTIVWAVAPDGSHHKSTYDLPLEVRDTRAGCPGTLAANADQVTATFTLWRTARIAIAGSTIAATTVSAARDDLTLNVNGTGLDSCLLNTQAGDGWGRCDVSALVTLGPGTHTASLRGNTANVWGCGGWGFIRVIEL